MLDDINDTELTAIAQEFNPRAHRALPRHILENLAKGESIDLPERRIDAHRLHIMEFINAHWQQVEPLLSCPARSRDARACFNCTDMQATECVVLNKTALFPKET